MVGKGKAQLMSFRLSYNLFFLTGEFANFLMRN